MPYICLRRADVPSGVLQVDDLWPRKSPKAAIFSPKAQGPLYLRQPEPEPTFTATSAAGAPSLEFRTDFRGLGAYLMDTMSNAGGAALTDAEATEIAEALIARVRAGSTMLEADILSEATAVSGAPSVYSATLVGDILRILSGEEYLVPSGTQIQDAGGAITAASGSFVGSGATSYYDGRFQYNSGNFQNSLVQGKLSVLTGTTFTYLGTTGAAVVLYDDDGSLL